MASDGWSYIVEQISGDGTGEFLDFDLELDNVSMTDVLSGALGFSASIDRELVQWKANGRPAFREWGTVIYPEADDEIRGGYILTGMQPNGPTLDLEFTSFVGYASEMPYDGSIYFIEEDPLNIVRHCWTHIQSQPRGNLGLQVANTTSPVRVGKQVENVEFQTGEGQMVAFEAGPVKLNYWSTDDLGAKINEFAKSTPFDYHERHAWNADRSAVEHFLDIGYPTLGTRRNDLRVVLGENAFAVPSLVLGEGYANHAIGLGAGEGRDMVRSPVLSVNDGRLRRVALNVDQSARSIKAATENARRTLARSTGDLLKVSEIVVVDHEHARISDLHVGDEILYQADTEWADVEHWCRIVSKTTAPARGDQATLAVVRTDLEEL